MRFSPYPVDDCKIQMYLYYIFRYFKKPTPNHLYDVPAQSDFLTILLGTMNETVYLKPSIDRLIWVCYQTIFLEREAMASVLLIAAIAASSSVGPCLKYLKYPSLIFIKVLIFMN